MFFISSHSQLSYMRVMTLTQWYDKGYTLFTFTLMMCVLWGDWSIIITMSRKLYTSILYIIILLYIELIVIARTCGHFAVGGDRQLSHQFQVDDRESSITKPTASASMLRSASMLQRGALGARRAYSGTAENLIFV